MRYDYVYSHSLKKTLKQLTKTQARKQYENGATIYLLASNMTIDNPWQGLCPIHKDSGVAIMNPTFDNMVSDFKYYNCDNERGKYVQYFVAIA